jgi:hypothetical protein
MEDGPQLRRSRVNLNLKMNIDMQRISNIRN